MDSYFISVFTLLAGGFLFYKKQVIGIWFIVEFFCDLLVTGLGDVTYLEMVTYRYLYATSAIFFTLFFNLKESLNYFFFFIAAISSLSGLANWFIKNDIVIEIIDTAYFITITCLEFVIIWVGLKYDNFWSRKD